MWINYWPRINNNKKGGVLVFFLTREFTQDLFKKRESFFCQEIIICCLKNLKIKWNIKKKKKEENSRAPRLLRQQRFTPLVVRSRDGGRDPESQLLGKPPGAPVISEALLCTHIWAGPPGFPPPVEGGQVTVAPSMPLSGRRKVSAQSVCHPPCSLLFQTGR